MIAARQIFLGRGGGAKLPYDAELEYLGSTGTQWIDTGRPIPSDFYFDATIDITGTSYAFKTLLGARIGSAVHDYQFSFYGADNRFLARYGNNRPQYFETLQTGLTRIRVESGGELYINESFVTQLGVDSPPELFNMYIFALNNNDSVSQQAKYIRLYSLKYGGTNEEHDLIPVRFANELGQSEGAMYDRVSGQLFRNKGTGDFVLGPDVVPVEYIEGYGAEWIDTGFKANTGTTSFEISLTPKNISQYPQGLFGSRNTASAADSSFNAFMMTGGAVRADFTGSARYINSGMTDNSLFVIRYDNRRVYVNGVSDILSYAENSTLQDYNFLVGSFTNGSDTPYSNGFIGLVHYVKLWSSGVLVRDLIPVRVGSGSTWEGAMMDTLTRRIYRNSNSGTGAFSYGPDK